MKTRQIAIGLMMAATVAPSAMAQTVPADVRCVMLSTLFANDAKDERGRQIASATLAFFMGRLDLRANAQVIAAAMRAQSTTIDPKSAGPAMNACEAQFGHAQQVVREASRIAAPSRK